MATSNDVVRYKFFGSCGILAEISNDGATAQRRKPQTEFNNAVLIGNEPLVDGVLFQVRIDKKVTSWTGSILIGEKGSSRLGGDRSLLTFRRRYYNGSRAF